eukprot:3159938-Amphidinium_carterae.1
MDTSQSLTQRYCPDFASGKLSDRKVADRHSLSNTQCMICWEVFATLSWGAGLDAQCCTSALALWQDNLIASRDMKGTSCDQHGLHNWAM